MTPTAPTQPLPPLPEGESYYVLAEFHGTLGAYNIDTAHRHCSGARQALFLGGGVRYVDITHAMVRGGILLPPEGMTTYGTPFSARTLHEAGTRASRAWAGERPAPSRARGAPCPACGGTASRGRPCAHCADTGEAWNYVTDTENAASKENKWEV